MPPTSEPEHRLDALRHEDPVTRHSKPCIRCISQDYTAPVFCPSDQHGAHAPQWCRQLPLERQRVRADCNLAEQAAIVGRSEKRPL